MSLATAPSSASPSPEARRIGDEDVPPRSGTREAPSVRDALLEASAPQESWVGDHVAGAPFPQASTGRHQPPCRGYRVVLPAGSPSPAIGSLMQLSRRA